VTEHIIFLFYIFIFIFSTIGHGEIFSRFVYKDLLEKNIGYQGMIGFFSISFISLISSFFFAHDYIHNIILHLIGIIGFLLFLKRYKKNQNELKYFLILILIFLIGAYVYKNHDDFPYYHLTYSLNLSENQFIIGTGIFSHGFRTFSSLFYYHSILYMPLIKFYLFHIGPFFIIIFFNYIVISEIFEKYKNNKINFLFYYLLLSLIFVDVAFYRISEHGTDRSAQVLLLLIFYYFFNLLYFEKNEKKISLNLSIILILIFLASSMKAIYYMYLILVPVILFKKKFFNKIFKVKNILIICIFSLSLFGNLLTNYFNTGCLLYPAEKTCIGDFEWSIPGKEVNRMSTHYEWWAKAGGGPGYKSDIKPEIYIKDFVWVKNWIQRHFFNKVSDTLLGIIFICIVVYFSFKYSSDVRKKNKINKNYYWYYFFPIIFLIEWFLNHPAMRYGGYVLIGIPLFILTSSILDKLNLSKKKIFTSTIIFVLIAITLFVVRNLVRLNKEITFYNYNILASPYFFVEKSKSSVIYDHNEFKVYTPQKGKMCWASKTPCSYYKEIKVKDFLGLKLVYRDDW
jgi:hypothetical protein